MNFKHLAHSTRIVVLKLKPANGKLLRRRLIHLFSKTLLHYSNVNLDCNHEMAKKVLKMKKCKNVYDHCQKKTLNCN